MSRQPKKDTDQTMPLCRIYTFNVRIWKRYLAALNDRFLEIFMYINRRELCGVKDIVSPLSLNITRCDSSYPSMLDDIWHNHDMTELLHLRCLATKITRNSRWQRNVNINEARSLNFVGSLRFFFPDLCAILRLHSHARKSSDRIEIMK